MPTPKYSLKIMIFIMIIYSIMSIPRNIKRLLLFLYRKCKGESHNLRIYLFFDPKKHRDISLLPRDIINEIVSYLDPKGNCNSLENILYNYRSHPRDRSSLKCVNKYLNNLI